MNDDERYRFRCAHSAYACEDVRARVVELETALRDWLQAADRCRSVAAFDLVQRLEANKAAREAARRVLGDRSGAAEDPEPHEQADRGE